MSNVKESLEKKINGLKTYLLTTHPFYATVILNLAYVIDENTHFPASTDCYKRIYLHPDIDQLSTETFKFINLHELLHVIFMHSQRKGNRNHWLWCIACDYAVNSVLIKEMRMDPPKELPCLYDPRFVGMPAEKIYDLLLEELRNKKVVKFKFVSFSSRTSVHDDDDENNEINNEDSVSITITIDDLCDCDQHGSGPCGNKKPQGEQGQGQKAEQKVLAPGDIHGSKNPAEEKERLRDILIQAHIMYEKFKDKTRGHLPGSVVEYIKKLVKPNVPFERLLARYASEVISGKGEYTFNPVNKKYAFYCDAVLPSTAKEEIPKIVVAVDSSGSMRTRDLELAAGAIKKLSSLTPEVTVIVCDHDIQQVIRTSEIEKFLKNVKFKGRGGTSHIPVFEYIDKNIKKLDVVICVTDGYSEYPEKKPKYPVIWLLTEDHKEPPWGMKVVMKEPEVDTGV